MIPRKNQYIGELGRTGKPGGSPMSSMPMTVDMRSTGYILGYYPADAFIELLSCTLNGLLMLWHTQNEENGEFVHYLDVDGLYWDSEAGSLSSEIYGSLNRKKSFVFEGQEVEVMDNVIARGVNWILTNFWIIKRNRDYPYIKGAQVFYVPSGSDKKLYILHSLQYNRDFLHTTSAGHTVGGGKNPFTGLETLGVVDYYENMVEYGNALSIRGREMDDFCVSMSNFDDWIMMEDYLIRVDENYNPSGFYRFINGKQVRTSFEAARLAVFPMIPLELNWTVDDRIPCTASMGTERYLQAITANGKIYARGLLRMGEAVIIPAAFDERGNPAEFFLLIQKTHDYVSAYDPITQPTMDANTDWMNMSPLILDGELYGYLTSPNSPTRTGICRVPEGRGIILPDGTAYNPRLDNTKIPPEPEKNEIYYDTSSGVVASMGEKGLTYVTTTENEPGMIELTEGTAWDCATLPQWIAPTGYIDSITEHDTVGTFDEGCVGVDIDNLFERGYFSQRILPVSYGAFDKIDPSTNEVLEHSRISIGVENIEAFSANTGMLETYWFPTVNHLGSTKDFTSDPFPNIPFKDVYKNPFRLEILKHDESGTYKAFWWTLKEAGLGNDAYAETNPYIPIFPVVYKNVFAGKIEWAWVNPDTGDFSPEEYDFGSDYEVILFPLNKTGANGEMMARCRHNESGVIADKTVNVKIPSWLQNDNWIRVGNTMDTETPERVPGLRIVPIPLPYPGGGEICYFDKTQSKILKNIVYMNGTGGMLRVVESSSNINLFWRNTEFGYRTNEAGYRYQTGGILNFGESTTSTAYLNNSNRRFKNMHLYSEDGAGYYGANFTTDCIGRKKALHTLMIWGVHPYEYIPLKADLIKETWSIIGMGSNDNHLYIVRADLDPDVFDFDAEMLRCKRT